MTKAAPTSIRSLKNDGIAAAQEGPGCLIGTTPAATSGDGSSA